MEHCCKSMDRHVNRKCDQHKNPFDCPDIVIYYSKKLGRYGIIIHDGGPSFYEITYCPWCGNLLTE